MHVCLYVCMEVYVYRLCAKQKHNQPCQGAVAFHIQRPVGIPEFPQPQTTSLRIKIIAVKSSSLSVVTKSNRDFGGHISQIPFSQIIRIFSMVLTHTVKVSDSTMFPPKNAWSDANLGVPGAARLCLPPNVQNWYLQTKTGDS